MSLRTWKWLSCVMKTENLYKKRIIFSIIREKNCNGAGQKIHTGNRIRPNYPNNEDSNYYFMPIPFIPICLLLWHCILPVRGLFCLYSDHHLLILSRNSNIFSLMTLFFHFSIFLILNPFILWLIFPHAADYRISWWSSWP